VAATTGYQATLYLALELSVIAAVLAIRTRISVATHTSILKEEKHESQSLPLSREIE